MTSTWGVKLQEGRRQTADIFTLSTKCRRRHHHHYHRWGKPLSTRDLPPPFQTLFRNINIFFALMFFFVKKKKKKRKKNTLLTIFLNVENLKFVSDLQVLFG